MTYTSHGHHIPGTPVEGKPLQVARCGGAGICMVCSREVLEGRRSYILEEDPLYEINKQLQLVFTMLDKVENSREKSLVMTKLDEAEMWLARCKNRPDVG